MGTHDRTTHSFPPDPAPEPDTRFTEERLPPGTRLGQFTVVRKIGGGGMGIVYEAVQDQPRRSVAIKVILKEWPSERDLTRFREEADLLARAEHAHIASVIEAKSEMVGGNRVAYIAMQYVNNAQTITQYAMQHRLSRRAKLELFAKVCRAVHWAHERGVVHRDLKPENILVDGSGEPRVIDFGIAKLNFGPGAQALAHLATTGHFVGSLFWAAPEQVRAGDSIDRRTDVYSLGLVLYRLMCGTHAYDLSRSTDSEAMEQIQKQPPTPPSTFDGVLKGEAELLILKALDKDPTKRFQSAAELAANVERLLAGEMVDAGELDRLNVVPRAMGSWASKHLWVCLAGVALIGCLVEYFTPFLFRHTELNVWFMRWVSSGSAVSLSELPDVRVIERDFADTPEGFEGAGLASLGIDAREPGWKRSLYARVLERLAEVPVKAVVLDHVFNPLDAPRHTEALAAAFRRLREKGVDSVVGVDFVDPATWPVLQQELQSEAGFGYIHIYPDSQSLTTIPIAMQREGFPPLPALSLRAIVAARHPGLDAEYHIDEPSQRVVLRYFKALPAGKKKYTGLEESVRFAQAEHPIEAVESKGQQADDMQFCIPVENPVRGRFASSVISMREVLSAPTPRLRELFSGRVVMLAGWSEQDADVIEAGDKTVLWLPLAHACMIQRFLSDGVVRMPTEVQTWLYALAFGVLGTLAAVAARGRIEAAVLVTLGLGACTVSGAFLAFKHLAYLINPIPLVLGMALACAIGTWLIATARRRAQFFKRVSA